MIDENQVITWKVKGKLVNIMMGKMAWDIVIGKMIDPVNGKMVDIVVGTAPDCGDEV